MSGFGTCRLLLDVSLIHFVVSLLSQIKSILGLADQRSHASTFVCVQLCSEGKIMRLSYNMSKTRASASSRLPNTNKQMKA